MPNPACCSVGSAKRTSPTVCRTGNQVMLDVVTVKGFDELSAHWESSVPKLSALQDCGELQTS